MLFTLLSWFYIGITSFLCGFAIFRLIRGRNTKSWEGFELYFFFGLCAITVYAQTFSLFYKVGFLANLVLVLICSVIVVLYYQQIKQYFSHISAYLKKPYVWLAVILFGTVMLIITAGTANHYDTDLYHAQAIRWIEEYRVVPGLGNFHNQLAFNSSFFTLQAFYSLKFLTGQSMHSVNGLFVTVILVYAFTTLGFFHKRKLAASDLVKISFFIYFILGEVHYGAASPSTDINTLYMVLYLAAKWSEYVERKLDNPVDYGLLCILAAWTVTLKLSGLMLMLLAVYPAVLLAVRKEWKKIGLFILTGMTVFAPFLIRNVIISGYIVYPFKGLDIFDVEWKMAFALLEAHNIEILAWGRGITNPADYLAPMSVWLPRWFEQLNIFDKTMVGLNIICLVIAVFYFIRSFRKRENWQVMTLFLVSILSLVYWVLYSPLVRFGYVYLLLLPALTGGIYLEKRKIMLTKTIIYSLLAAGVFAGIFAGYRIFQGRPEAVIRYLTPPLIRQADYIMRDSEAVEWQGIIIYIPVTYGDDRVGYHNFPGMPSALRLEPIELRTGDLQDGFRISENYK
jgi:hypothetical protein